MALRATKVDEKRATRFPFSAPKEPRASGSRIHRSARFSRERVPQADCSARHSGRYTMTSPKDLELAGLIHDLNNVFQTIVEAADLLSNDPKWVTLPKTIFRS